MNRGQFKIIRVDGTEEVIEKRPTFSVIETSLGAGALDTVRIGRNPANGSPSTVMFVDDNGVATKPVNQKATKLYHSVCVPGTTQTIHGDVAIVNDEDFG